MKPETLLFIIQPYLERYAANFHERVDLIIATTKNRQLDTDDILKSMLDEIPLLLLQEIGSNKILDSHTGKVTEYKNVTLTLEMRFMIQSLFLVEIIRQSSHIHTNRGKIKDTQYAFTKALIQEYFNMVKGNPDVWLIKSGCNHCGKSLREVEAEMKKQGFI